MHDITGNMLCSLQLNLKALVYECMCVDDRAFIVLAHRIHPYTCGCVAVRRQWIV